MTLTVTTRPRLSARTVALRRVPLIESCSTTAPSGKPSYRTTGRASSASRPEASRAGYAAGGAAGAAGMAPVVPVAPALTPRMSKR